MLKNKLYNLLRWSEKYTKTDMVYLAQGGFWLNLGQVAASIFSLILVIFFANLLPAETYGKYKYILSIFAILSAFSLGGINTVIFQNASHNNKSLFYQSVITKVKYSLLGSIISLIIALYYKINGDNEISQSLIVLAFIIPLIDPLSSYDSLLQGQKKLRQSTLYFITGQIFILIATLSLSSFFDYSLTAIISAYFISSVIAKGLAFIATSKKLKSSSLENKENNNKEIKYGIKLSLINIIPILSQNIDKLIIFNLLSPWSLAIYSVSLAIPEQIKSFIKSWHILFINKIINKDRAEASQIFLKKLPILIGALSLIIVILFFLIEPFFQLLFKNYTEAIFYTKLYSLSIFGILYIFPISLMNLYKETKKIKNLQIIKSLTQIILLAFMTYYFGIIGAILARVISELIIFIISLILIKN